MTFLRKVRVYNACQHRDVAIEVGPGLVVLTGAMGSGKTNLLELIFGSLGNDFRALYGNKKGNIRRGAEKEPAYIQTGWEIGSGDELEINRYLQKGASTLFLNGQDLKLRGESDITAKIAATLGIDPKLLRENCFVSQSATSAIVEAEDTDRAKFWANLLGANWLLKLQAPVAAELERVSALVGYDWQLDIDEISREIDKLNQECETHGKAIAQWQLAVLPEEQADQIRLSIDRASTVESHRRDRQRLLMQLQRLREQLEGIRTKVEPLEEARALAKERLQLFQRQAASHQHNLRIDDAKLELSRLAEQEPVNRLIKPVPPKKNEPSREEVESVRQTVAKLSAELRVFRRGKSVCSECQQPIDLSPKKGKELQERFEESSAKLKEIEAIRTAWLNYQTATKNYEAATQTIKQQREAWAKTREQVLQRIRDLGEPHKVSPMTGTAQDLANNIASIERQIQAVTGGESEAAIAEQIARAEGELKIVETYLKQNRLPQTLSILEEQLRVHDEAKQEVVRLKGLQDRAEGAIGANRAKLLSAQQKLARQKPLNDRKAALEAAKKLLRAAELPSQVLSVAAENLISKANNLCEQLDLPFQLRMSDEFDLIAQHADGAEEPVRRLSHGQRACVSVALWIAKLATCDTGIDVLVLDEPSANMDDTGVRMFAEMLLSLGEYLQATKLQVWLTTHHRQLAGCGQYHLHLGG